MIKKLVHFSDLHIRLFKDHELYRGILMQALSEWKALAPDRIVFTGDLVHSKNQMTPELVEFVAWVLALVVLMVLGVFLYNQFASRNNIPQPQTDNIASESYESNVTQNSEKAETNNLQQEGEEDL